jgi:hypothetical protein
MKSIFYPYEVSKAIDVYDFSVLAAEVSNPILPEAPESSAGFLCTRELFIRFSLTFHDVKLLIAHCCQILTGREQFCQTLIPASEWCERSRLVMCMAWPQAKSQAKPSQKCWPGVGFGLAWTSRKPKPIA